eukprot:SAG31_NODE_2015_length_6664_cov_32.172734_2_plen_151_part_00
MVYVRDLSGPVFNPVDTASWSERIRARRGSAAGLADADGGGRCAREGKCSPRCPEGRVLPRRGAPRDLMPRARGARADRAAAGGGDESQSDREYDLAYKFNNTGPVSRPACMSLPTAPRGRVERVVILPTIDSTSGSSNSVPVGCRAKIY